MGQAYIVRRGGGGGALDIITAATLPAAVTNNQLVIITGTSPSLITVDTAQPDGSTGDIWVRLRGEYPPLTLETDEVLLNARVYSVHKYSGIFWDRIDAYLGTEGSWEQVSSTVTIMGIKHYTTNGSPDLERTDDAVGLSAIAGVGAVAQVSDFDNMPIYRDIKTCNLAANRTVNAWEGDAGFKRDGTNGDVMVWIPKFWYKVSANDGVETWQIADGEVDGFTLHEAFNRGVPLNDLDGIYVSAYETVSGYASKSGVAPLTNMTRAVARSNSAAKGNGWSQMDVAATMAVNLIMYIEYASLNMQAAVGFGNGNNNSAINTGGTDSMAGHTGRAAGNAITVAVKWRGIENWWGNVNTWVDGLNISNYTPYFCLVPSGFADNTTANYTAVEYSCGSNSGYVKTMGLKATYPWLRLPTAKGGSETLYYCDYFYTNTGWRVAAFGGSYSDGSSCGPADWSLYYDSAFSSSIIGCRLLCRP